MRLDAADAAQIAEQLSARNELHDKVEVTGILRESFKLNLGLSLVTMKGWWSMLSIWL